MRIETGEAEGSRWEMAARPTPLALRPFVRSIVGYDERAPGPQERRHFPGPSVVVIVEFGVPLSLCLDDGRELASHHQGGFVVGLRDRFALTRHLGRQQGIQIDLTPTGARRLLGLPLRELTGEAIALRELLEPAARNLPERLGEAPDWSARLDLIEMWLARRILEESLDTAPVDWAVAHIESSGGRLSVGALAEALGHSHKHLISLFHDRVGVTPKRLARLVRFDGLIRDVRLAREVSWSELALAHGYADQAHLVREVKQFTGLTPTAARDCVYVDLLG